MVELIEVSEFHDFPDALRFALAAASSSKNVGEFLKRIPLNVFAAEQVLPYDFIHAGMALLNEADADLVVTSLDDVAVRAQYEGRLDRAIIR